MSTTQDDCEQFRAFAQKATREEMEGFFQLEVFATEHEALLYAILMLMPDMNKEDIKKTFCVNDAVADFLIQRMTFAFLCLGADGP